MMVLTFVNTTGANVNFQHPLRANQTAIFEASSRNFVHCLIFLLDKGAIPSVKDNSGATALHKAAYFGHEKPLEV